MRPREGDVLDGRFWLDREVAPGSHGASFEAVDLTTGAPCIVDVASGVSSPQERARFAVDAAVAQRLDGRHVLRVHGSGALDDATPWVAREPTLATLATEIHERGPLPLAEAIAWTLQACEALAEAHAAGLAHRNLGPETVFIARAARGLHVAKVNWQTGASGERLDRSAVQRDIAAVANLLRALVSGGRLDAATTLPADLVHTVARATSGEEPFANVAELARALARHVPRGDSAARRIASPFSRAGVIGSAIPLSSEPIHDGWFARGSTHASGTPKSRGEALFTAAALTVLGAVIGGMFALARASLIDFRDTTPELARTTITSAETGTTEHAERVVERAVIDFSRAKRPPRRDVVNHLPPASYAQEVPPPSLPREIDAEPAAGDDTDDDEE